MNLTFNQALRLLAERYVARVHQDLGLHNFSEVRIGSGGLIESLYPGMHDGAHDNSYWAFDGISYLASRSGLPKNGENPGRVDTSAYGKAMMEASARQMRACGFQGFMWAHDSNLYDGTSGVTLGDYSAIIAQYSS